MTTTSIKKITIEIYEVLTEIVGQEYISIDPAICEGYRSGPGGYESGLGYERVMTCIPGCIILPRTTEEVQKIVRVCNRFKVPYVPYSTGFYGPRSHPHVEGALLIDMKRMNDFEIDERHLYAVVANLIGDGWSPLSHRIGLPHRRILGTEFITPDGELVKMGSLTLSDDPFWGDGIGPDLRGMLRGYTGLRGCLGIVTKMAVKLLPFQPEKLLPTGISPNTHLQLPQNRVKWINFTVTSTEHLRDAMYEIAQAEIGAAVTKVPLFWRALAKARSKEEFWELWSKENEQTVASFFVLRVMLVAFTSEAQMAYEERVLADIMKKHGAEPRSTKPSDESWFKNADSAGMWLMTGSYVSVDYVIETIEHAVKHGQNYAKLKKKYTPPLMPDYGDPGWFQSFELGHQGYSEFLVYWDQDENTDGVDQFYLETSKDNIKKHFYTSLLGPHQPLYLTGPAFGPNYHKWMLAFKEEFDPNWVSHPPVPFAHDEFVDRAKWMRPMKDWPTPKNPEYKKYTST
jgi:glycolate oxidase